ncbi:hypothetical protein ACLX1H_003564 [Fusarium chlamydosporum]
MTQSFLSKQDALALVIVLLIVYSIRWFGLFLHHCGRMAHRTTPRGEMPSNINLRDIAVILPVVDHESASFVRTVESILENLPGQLYVVLVGREALEMVRDAIATLRRRYGHTQIHISAVNKANKRRQIAHAMDTISYRDTRLTVITDQGAYWPPLFLMSACYPFDDTEVAAVTVPKRVHMPPSDCIWDHVKAHLFSFHYSLQAEDIRSVNSLDGSALFGGPTTLVRTHYLKEDRFKNECEQEKWFFERSGVLKGDEHFYLARYLIGSHKSIYFQDSPEATVSVEMNSLAKFIGEFLRTTRNDWRTCYLMAPTCAWNLVRHRHVIYPAAALMTWWPTLFSFIPFALIVDFLSIVLAFNYGLLSDGLLAAWLGVASSVVGLQFISGLFVAGRMFYSDGNNFNVITTCLCIMLAFPFQCTLEFVKTAALLTFWKADTEERVSQDIEMVGESQIPWHWDHMYIDDDDEEYWNVAHNLSWRLFAGRQIAGQNAVSASV